MGRNEQKLENMALVKDPLVFLLQVGYGMVREDLSNIGRL
jgi:hypothetical protein